MEEKRLKKLEIILLGIICSIIVILFFMHPRLNYCLMIFFCIIHIIVLSQVKKKKDDSEKKKYSFSGDFVASLFLLLILWFFGSVLTVVYPYHAPYEYKRDISVLRNRKPTAYAHFPDEIPHDAKGIKWVNFPSVLQGKGYEGLFYFTNDEEIFEVFQKYRSDAKIYRAINNESSNAYSKFQITFPMENYIPEGTEEDVEVFVLYDNEDWNHPSMYGFYINRKEKYICYFSM